MTEVEVGGEVYLVPRVPTYRAASPAVARREGNRSPPKRPPSRSASRYGTPVTTARGPAPPDGRGPNSCPKSSVSDCGDPPRHPPPATSNASLASPQDGRSPSLQFRVIDDEKTSGKGSIKFTTEMTDQQLTPQDSPQFMEVDDDDDDDSEGAPHTFTESVSFQVEPSREPPSIQFHNESMEEDDTQQVLTIEIASEERSPSDSPEVRFGEDNPDSDNNEDKEEDDNNNDNSNKEGEKEEEQEESEEKESEDNIIQPRLSSNLSGSDPSLIRETANPSPQKRRADPNAYDKPWRSGSTPRRSTRNGTPKEVSTPTTPAGAAAANDEATPRGYRPTVYDRPWRTNSKSPAKKKKSPTPSAKKRKKSSVAAAAGTTPQQQQQQQEEREGPPSVLGHTVEPRQHSSTAPPSVHASSLLEAPSSTEAPPSPLSPRKKEEAPPPPEPLSALETIGAEVQEWGEVVSQQTTLLLLLQQARERERWIQQADKRNEVEARTLSRVTAELYRRRDCIVRKTGCDVTGARLYSGRRSSPSRTPRPTSARSPRKSFARYIDRLYPHDSVAPQGTNYVEWKRQQKLENPSVLSDDEITEEEREENAKALAEWRSERETLRKIRAQLLREQKELRYHVRRGTNIKDISAVTPVSPRNPIVREATGHHTAVDAAGHDRIAALRLQAKSSEVQLAAAKEALQKEEAMRQGRRGQLQQELQQLKEHHTQKKQAYTESVQQLQRCLLQAHQLKQDTQANRGLTPRRRFDAHTLLADKIKAVEGILAEAKLNHQEARRKSRSRSRSATPRRIQ